MFSIYFSVAAVIAVYHWWQYRRISPDVGKKDLAMLGSVLAISIAWLPVTLDILITKVSRVVPRKSAVQNPNKK